MKALYKVILGAGVFISIVICLWSVLFYITTMREIDDEIEDSLELYAFQIIQEKNEGKLDSVKYDGSNNSFIIEEITKEEASVMENMSFKDTNIFIAARNETEPCKRLIIPFYDINDNYYKLTIYTPTIEKIELKERILVLLFIIVIILITSVITIYLSVYKKALNPLYILLNWHRDYQLGKNEQEFPECKSNIKEMQELFNAAKSSTQRAEEAYKQQKLFLGHASHEIQTPLAVSITQLESLLEDESLNEEQMNKIFTTISTLRKMTRMNKSLLMLSKIENNQFNNKELVNINAIIHEKIDLFKETFSQKQITIQINEKDSLDIEIDNILCDMLINNLLKNALIHNVQGGDVTIDINKDSIRFSNSGKHTALNEKMIFNYFYKESNEQNSSGLGLVLIKSICKKNNLSIDYQFIETKHSFFITKN
ncbi:MAG: HAMP domain-containing histidine kinase [Bacteroidales bacterium]|nr:HAMP domain-containing histidine kinase [Bacteroidales bacterium]